LKKSIFDIISPLSSICTTSLYQNITNKKLIFPFYHSVSDCPQFHINSLYKTLSVKEFENDLLYLLKHFEIIEPDKIFQLIRNKQQPAKPSFLLTFDDGLSEFYEIIAPILIQKGIPAINFLNTAFIDNKNLFYRYKASLLINHIKENPQLNKLLSVFFADNGFANNNLYNIILSINFNNRKLFDKAAKICNYSFEDFLQVKKPYLTSVQINELSKQGFLFGAHSINHPKYSELNLQEQIRQTKESVEFVKNKFEQPYKLFAFPFTDFGVSSELFNKFFNHENHILDFSFANAGLKNDEFCRNIQRIPMEGTSASGKKIIKTEYLYYLLKAALSKNSVIH